MDDLLPVDLPDASLLIINSPHQSSAAASAELSLPTPNASETTDFAVARTVSQTAVCDVSSVLGYCKPVVVMWWWCARMG